MIGPQTSPRLQRSAGNHCRSGPGLLQTPGTTEPGDPLKRNKGASSTPPTSPPCQPSSHPNGHPRVPSSHPASRNFRGSAAQIAGSVGQVSRGRFSRPSTPSTTAGTTLVDGIDIDGHGEQETPTRPRQDDDDDDTDTRDEPAGTTTGPNTGPQRGPYDGTRGRNDRGGHGLHSEYRPEGTPAACGAGLRPVPSKEEQVRRVVSMHVLQR